MGGAMGGAMGGVIGGAKGGAKSGAVIGESGGNCVSSSRQKSAGDIRCRRNGSCHYNSTG